MFCSHGGLSVKAEGKAFSVCLALGKGGVGLLTGVTGLDASSGMCNPETPVHSDRLNVEEARLAHANCVCLMSYLNMPIRVMSGACPIIKL